jgi:hypothetical protein
MKDRAREDWVIAVAFAVALVWSLAMASRGWSHAISDDHGWRQTQTAISAYFIQQGGPWLAYETPVLGPPWALPHEFPVYQLVVAGLSRTTGLQLEAAGRTVSLAFFYASLGVAFLLLAELGLRRMHRLLVIALWLPSPVYLFWSRTFMIESTALFFSLVFLTCAARFFSRGRTVDAVLAVAAGATAYAMKPPAVAGFVGLGCLWWGVQYLRKPRRPLLATILGLLVLVAPIAIGSAWHGYGDSLKQLNPFGWAWTSEAIRNDWILSAPGTNASLGRRLEPATRDAFWRGALPLSVGHPAVVVLALACCLVARRRRLQCAVLVGAAVAHFAVFAPLHLGHTYYQYGLGLFLVAAVGLAVVALLECNDRRRYLAGVLALLMASTCVDVYWSLYRPVQRRNAYRKGAWFVRLGSALTGFTRPEEVIVGFGLDWNPEVPYYARRRALMWPGWGDWRADSKDVARALEQLEGWRVGALFNCSNDTPEDTLVLFRRRLGLQDVPTAELPTWTQWRTCVIYTRADKPAQGTQGP